MEEPKTPKEIPTRRPFSSETEISLRPTRLGIRLRNVNAVTVGIVIIGLVTVAWIIFGR